MIFYALIKTSDKKQLKLSWIVILYGNTEAPLLSILLAFAYNAAPNNIARLTSISQ